MWRVNHLLCRFVWEVWAPLTPLCFPGPTLPRTLPFRLLLNNSIAVLMILYLESNNAVLFCNLIFLFVGCEDQSTKQM